MSELFKEYLDCDGFCPSDDARSMARTGLSLTDEIFNLRVLNDSLERKNRELTAASERQAAIAAELGERAKKAEADLAALRERVEEGIPAWIASRHESDDLYLFCEEPEHIAIDDDWAGVDEAGYYLGESAPKWLEPGTCVPCRIVRCE